MIEDLGLDTPWVRGQQKRVNNCWHFSTDGNFVDAMFYCDEDFKDGMNRVFVVLQEYDVVILAFSLMDTHVHFILYGEFDSCNRFVRDYLHRTSRYIFKRRVENNKLRGIPVSWQRIDTEEYLKTAICYVVKNAPVGGKPFLAGDYPWSSGPLYFRSAGQWCSPSWTESLSGAAVLSAMGIRQKRKQLKTRAIDNDDVRMIGDMVFPGDYVAHEVVERLFRTHKAYHYFFCRSREDDVESKGGYISQLSIPMQEMRQHKNEMCKEMFGHNNTNRLDVGQRLRLARALKAKYNSSLKQIVRLCGLVYDEVKDKLK